jgi:Virulence activator alpha C-term
VRDEGMLKLFFSDGMAPDERVALVRALRARQEDKLARLRSIEDDARRGGGGPYAALRYGLAVSEFSARWLADLERELEETTALERR